MSDVSGIHGYSSLELLFAFASNGFFLFHEHCTLISLSSSKCLIWSCISRWLAFESEKEKTGVFELLASLQRKWKHVVARSLEPFLAHVMLVKAENNTKSLATARLSFASPVLVSHFIQWVRLWFRTFLALHWWTMMWRMAPQAEAGVESRQNFLFPTGQFMHVSWEVIFFSRFRKSWRLTPKYSVLHFTSCVQPWSHSFSLLGVYLNSDVCSRSSEIRFFIKITSWSGVRSEHTASFLTGPTFLGA